MTHVGSSPRRGLSLIFRAFAFASRALPLFAPYSPAAIASATAADPSIAARLGLLIPARLRGIQPGVYPSGRATARAALRAEPAGVWHMRSRRLSQECRCRSSTRGRRSLAVCLLLAMFGRGWEHLSSSKQRSSPSWAANPMASNSATSHSSPTRTTPRWSSDARSPNISPPGQPQPQQPRPSPLKK